MVLIDLGLMYMLVLVLHEAARAEQIIESH